MIENSRSNILCNRETTDKFQMMFDDENEGTPYGQKMVDVEIILKREMVPTKPTNDDLKQNSQAWGKFKTFDANFLKFFYLNQDQKAV